MGDIDESDCFDSWEELEDSGVLDKRIEKMQIPSVQLQNGLSSSGSRTGPVIILNEDLRSRYVPQEPSVKILRRPPTTNCCDLTNSENKPKQPVKTLQQREMEYAKARARILGEARSPEEECSNSEIDDRPDKILSKTQLLKQPEPPCGVIRLPKGPDDTKGFNIRR